MLELMIGNKADLSQQHIEMNYPRVHYMYPYSFKSVDITIGISTTWQYSIFKITTVNNNSVTQTYCMYCIITWVYACLFKLPIYNIFLCLQEISLILPFLSWKGVTWCYHPPAPLQVQCLEDQNILRFQRYQARSKDNSGKYCRLLHVY